MRSSLTLLFVCQSELTELFRGTHRVCRRKTQHIYGEGGGQTTTGAIRHSRAVTPNAGQAEFGKSDFLHCTIQAAPDVDPESLQGGYGLNVFWAWRILKRKFPPNFRHYFSRPSSPSKNHTQNWHAQKCPHSAPLSDF